MISVNLSASCGATRCHCTWVWENPCSSISGGPLPPTRAKIRPAEVLIHSEPKPGNKSARSGISHSLMSSSAKADDPVFQRQQRSTREVAAYWLPRCSGVRQLWLLQTLFVVAAGTSQVYAILQVRSSRTPARKCHVDRFRSPGRSQGDPREGPQMGA